MRAITIRMSSIHLAIASLLVISLFIGIVGYGYWGESDLAVIPNQKSEAPTGAMSIVVKIPARILELHEDGKIYKRYSIAVGRSETPTPIGDWRVIWKSHRSADVLGTRFLGIDVPWGGYGIHGTDRPWSIGHFISQRLYSPP